MLQQDRSYSDPFACAQNSRCTNTYHLTYYKKFDRLKLLNIGILSAHEAKIDTMANELRDDLLNDGTTLEGMLVELRMLRELDQQAQRKDTTKT